MVLDTNVFVAAGFNPGSASACIVGAVRDGWLRMAWSDATRGETERVLGRIPPLRPMDPGPLFRGEERVEPPGGTEGLDVVSDPADRKFAALAKAAGAVLVTADDHLLSVRDVLGATVLAPREFVERYGLESR